MRTDDFDFLLPPELIAAHPAAKRDASRLLVLEREGNGLRDQLFSDLPDMLKPGDCLVLNDSRVIPARLIGEREGGGRAEVLLFQPEGTSRWRALVRPAKKLSLGCVVTIPAKDSQAAVVIVIEEESSGGERVVRIEAGTPIEELLSAHGNVPLPPYILSARRELGETKDSEEDWERYQTVYAREGLSVAAPTAGLHFTPELLDRIRARGIEIRRVRLDVGPGTFVPVIVDDPNLHPMHEEHYIVARDEAEAIEAARRDSQRRIVAVGTTVTRVLESMMAKHGKIQEADERTRLLILPEYEFRAVDALVTNFHLPRSTLLMLVCAFAGSDRILSAYAHAVRTRYRFYSYGDAMFIQRG